MPLVHLCWDFDGTLYDTYGALTQAMLQALHDFQYQASFAEVYFLLKQSAYRTLTVYASRLCVPVERLQAAYRHYHRAIQGFTLYPGAANCLRTLRQQGCFHYLYTHRDSSAIRALKADGLFHLFTDCITREDAFPDKPAPDALLFLIQKHHINPRQALMLGDRPIDIQAGQGAGMHTLLFDPDGYYPKLQASHTANTMAEICTLVAGAP